MDDRTLLSEIDPLNVERRECMMMSKTAILLLFVLCECVNAAPAPASAPPPANSMDGAYFLPIVAGARRMLLICGQSVTIYCDDQWGASQITGIRIADPAAQFLYFSF